ncbi:MAG: hypothetical protein SGPRY_010176 [Prymnesium sp.]
MQKWCLVRQEEVLVFRDFLEVRLVELNNLVHQADLCSGKLSLHEETHEHYKSLPRLPDVMSRLLDDMGKRVKAVNRELEDVDC